MTCFLYSGGAIKLKYYPKAALKAMNYCAPRSGKFFYSLCLFSGNTYNKHMSRLIIILLGFGLIASAQNMANLDLIKDPAISLRCKNLLDKRGNKIEMQQRLNALLKRNMKLLESLPKNREMVREKLQFTETRLKNQIRLSNLSTQKLEETIVRRGCPGVAL